VRDALADLLQRVARLDAEPSYPMPGCGSAADLHHFTAVLAQVTSTGPVSDPRLLPVVAPSEADAAIAASALVGRLLTSVEEIVAGPLRHERQYWIATRKPSHVPSPQREPAETHFRPALDGAVIPESTKPFFLGLFTSTGVLGGHGMWRTYLDVHEGSSLFPRPWHTWAMRPGPDVAVCEITSATEWADLVHAYPRLVGALTYPDWRSIARDYDAVHMTIRAIAATQGLYCQDRRGIVAAPFWDVESTLWLRWSFTGAELAEVTS
jgi:hypothetical protein